MRWHHVAESNRQASYLSQKMRDDNLLNWIFFRIVVYIAMEKSDVIRLFVSGLTELVQEDSNLVLISLLWRLIATSDALKRSVLNALVYKRTLQLFLKSSMAACFLSAQPSYVANVYGTVRHCPFQICHQGVIIGLGLYFSNMPSYTRTSHCKLGSSHGLWEM